MLENKIDDLLKCEHFDSVGKILALRNDAHDNHSIFTEWLVSAEPLLSKSLQS